MKPLSVGNVVSAGLRIYRDNFKKYYRLALIAALWSWIPIYGWAKFYFAQGVISRLAFSEITEQPETVTDVERNLKNRFWRFLGVAFLVFLRLLGAYILGGLVLALGLGILIFALSFLLSFTLGDLGSSISSVVSVITLIVGLIIFLGYLTRLLASWFVSELALATEDDVDASQSLKRSQELTKGYIVNVVIILIVSFVISFPLWGIIFTIQILPSFLSPEAIPFPAYVFTIFQLIFNSITSALIIPYWQSIKAVVYYDLRVRREGMGIDLGK